MRIDWSLRWWDLLALAVSLLTAALVLQYSVGRGHTGLALARPVEIDVRVSRPCADLVNLIGSGDLLLDSRARPAGRILFIQTMPALGITEPNAFAGERDLLIRLRMESELTLVRRLSGFPAAPGSLKAGVWCLISTPRVEMSGLIVGVKESPSPAGTK